MSYVSLYDNTHKKAEERNYFNERVNDFKDEHNFFNNILL